MIHSGRSINNLAFFQRRGLYYRYMYHHRACVICVQRQKSEAKDSSVFLIIFIVVLVFTYFCTRVPVVVDRLIIRPDLRPYTRRVNENTTIY